MANERLRTAMTRAQVDIEAVSEVARVDPKTVHRWLGGRVPHPRHRWAVAGLLSEDEEFLWPGAKRQTASGMGAAAEIVAAYPYRADLGPPKWRDLFANADHQIDLLGYTLLFLAEQHPGLVDLLQDKCAAGCKVRLVVADPDCQYVKDRDQEEQIGVTLVARIRTTLKYYRPLLDCPGLDMRYQRAPLYNSIFRFDDEMLVTPHLYGTSGFAAPLLHLRRLGPNGLFSRFAAHFEAIWATTTPLAGDRPAVALRSGS